MLLDCAGGHYWANLAAQCSIQRGFCANALTLARLTGNHFPPCRKTMN